MLSFWCSVLEAFSLCRKYAVTGNRVRCTLLSSVHSLESSVGTRSYHASDPLLVCAAVGWTALSSREAIGRFRSSWRMPILGPVATWDNGPEVPDACIPSGVLCVCPLCNIRLAIPKLTPNVPWMRLCSSLSILKCTSSGNSGEDLSFQILLKTEKN